MTDTAKITANANSKMGQIELAVLDRAKPVVERMATIGRLVDDYRRETTIGDRVNARILALLSPPEPEVIRTRSLTVGDYVWIVVEDGLPRRASKADITNGIARMTIVERNEVEADGMSHSTRVTVVDDNDLTDDEVTADSTEAVGVRHRLPAYINVLASRVP